MSKRTPAFEPHYDVINQSGYRLLAGVTHEYADRTIELFQRFADVPNRWAGEMRMRSCRLQQSGPIRISMKGGAA